MLEWIIMALLSYGGGTTHLATTYGAPGDKLSGERLACTGQRVRDVSEGVAHRSAPCGTLVHLRFRGRSTLARVVDRGPYWAVPRACAQRLHRTAHRCWLRGWIRVGWRCKKPNTKRKKYKWERCRPQDWPHANDWDLLPGTAEALRFTGKAFIKARPLWKP